MLIRFCTLVFALASLSSLASHAQSSIQSTGAVTTLPFEPVDLRQQLTVALSSSEAVLAATDYYGLRVGTAANTGIGMTNSDSVPVSETTVVHSNIPTRFPSSWALYALSVLLIMGLLSEAGRITSRKKLRKYSLETRGDTRLLDQLGSRARFVHPTSPPTILQDVEHRIANQQLVFRRVSDLESQETRNAVDTRTDTGQTYPNAAITQAIDDTPAPAADGMPNLQLSAADDQFIRSVQSVVVSKLEDDGFGVAQLASAVGLDRSQLYRKLRRLTGNSPTNFLMQQRLEHAAELLAGTTLYVGEVAYSVGFKSVSHFSRRFRQRYACSPTEYRRDATKESQD